MEQIPSSIPKSSGLVYKYMENVCIFIAVTTRRKGKKLFALYEHRYVKGLAREECCPV